MAKRTFRAGATSQTIDVFIQDTTSSSGAGLSGLVYNSSGLTAYYRVGATGTATALSLATQTVGGAWSSGGFVEVQATNMKGVYRLDVPNAVLASAPYAVIYLFGATNMAPVPIELEIVSYDPFDADLGIDHITVSDILTTQMTESYASDGVAPTVAQALYFIQQMLGEFSIAGTTLTVKRINGSSTAATFTLDDATAPTSVTRVS